MALKTKYSPLQRFSLENLYNAFAGMAPREKSVALAGLGLLVLMVLFLPFSLVSGKLRSMQREIASAQQGSREVVQKIADYRKAKAEIASLERRFGEGGGLTTRVEGAAKKVSLTVDQLKERAPQETDFLSISTVEVKISNANLAQLVDFFREIENDPRQMMRFRRIQMKPKTTNRQLLDISCEIATFALRKEG